MKYITDRTFYKRFKNFLQEGPAEDFTQILDLPVDQFVDKFKDIANEPEVQAIIKAGQHDGKPTDEVVKFSSKDIPVKNLHPTQNEIGMNESLLNILEDKYGQLDTFLKGGAVLVKGPILVLNDEWIIDGHHRWSQLYVSNPDASIKSIVMKANIEPQDALKAVQMSIAAAKGDLPLVSANGINLLTAPLRSITRFIKENITQTAIDKFYKARKIAEPTAEQLIARISKNILMMQKTSQPMAGAPDRDFMPQTGDAPEFIKHLKQGMVNFIDPKPSDISNEAE